MKHSTSNVQRSTFKLFSRLLLVAGLMSFSASCFGAAILEGYVSGSFITATTRSTVVFPAAPTKSIRLVSYDVASGTATGYVAYAGGTTVTTMTKTNTLTGNTGTNIYVASTNGFAVGDTVVLQGSDDTAYAFLVDSFSTTTNLAVSEPIPALFAVGTKVYRMGDYRTSVIGATTIRVAGEALMIAQRRKPVIVQVYVDTGGKVNNAVVHYDDN